MVSSLQPSSIADQLCPNPLLNLRNPRNFETLKAVTSRTLKLTLAYDGSAFHGWQVQPGKPTIQGTLAEVIESLTGEKLLPQGSGRTDAGVHALAQIATFQTASSIPTANFRTVLNDRLPAAIRVLAVEEMPEGFHARHSALAKRYHYRIWRADVVPPFLARYVTHHPVPAERGRHAAGSRAGRRRARLYLVCRRRS